MNQREAFEQQLAAMTKEREKLLKVVEAERNLRLVNGRFHTEAAYLVLTHALDEADATSQE